MNQLGINHTRPDKALTIPGLCKWAIAKIDRECFKGSFIYNTSSRFTTFSNLSPELVIISL